MVSAAAGLRYSCLYRIECVVYAVVVAGRVEIMWLSAGPALICREEVWWPL